ncbi:hypothetical protein [Pontibacter chinhatensis]|uniref:RNA repair, ligase-Pnkp-associating, region of Hen1 n=1 Tax=Pontibacter chinhatensis TaxID=1436961 RepID=A0A1I2ZX66_9BACT|nr:hypothetical protein [Pontibacter chinhatensis]SFH42069.1 RNA repair, ligase-Pnkp-associating, region of Hen1 [Pontibacter chinhatensis]
MILEITTTHKPATDLGYLLHKHPDKVQSVELAAGKAHVFYPEATAERCTACSCSISTRLTWCRCVKAPMPCRTSICKTNLIPVTLAEAAPCESLAGAGPASTFTNSLSLSYL